jgi:hypothetical protein
MTDAEQLRAVAALAAHARGGLGITPAEQSAENPGFARAR